MKNKLRHFTAVLVHFLFNQHTLLDDLRFSPFLKINSSNWQNGCNDAWLSVIGASLTLKPYTWSTNLPKKTVQHTLNNIIT